MKDEVTEVYLVRMGVPSNGIPIYSDFEFENPDEGIEMMSRAYDDGTISGWTMYKVVRAVAYHRIDGQGVEE